MEKVLKFNLKEPTYKVRLANRATTNRRALLPPVHSPLPLIGDLISNQFGTNQIFGIDIGV